VPVRPLPPKPLPAKPKPLPPKKVAKVIDENASKAAQTKAWLEDINASDARTLIKKAYKSLQSGENEYAVLALTRAVKLDPNNPLARQYLAYALSTDDPAAALSQYLAFQKIQPGGFTQKISFAEKLAGAADKEPAKQFFDQMILEQTNNYSALDLLAEKCETLGLTKQAANAAVLGMQSRIPEQQRRFQRLYQKLQGTSATPQQGTGAESPTK
jgi:predicted Zn-dependent protease